MRTLRSQSIEIGRPVQVIGILDGDGGLAPLGPTPAGSPVPFAMRTRLHLPGVSAVGGPFLVRGVWDGVTISAASTAPVPGAGWLGTEQVQPGRGGETPGTWSDEDCERASAAVPEEHLIGIGRRSDPRGRPVVIAEFVLASARAIAWQESCPPGVVDAVAWIRPVQEPPGP
ncbi:hypothetical protein GCG21_10120 [Pseudactinotalea sp. HY160]|uniref:hypothetical protein n=1 Tax=Pseudactinotalea sp. HY160 TaxID=2654490 RepID=UPI00128D3929|nr:hypothetical protein [Pseudactinotalea sp. HY160]MPV50351.1 hypothetical protein [Pseudactinotalea sp. HY160]